MREYCAFEGRSTNGKHRDERQRRATCRRLKIDTGIKGAAMADVFDHSTQIGKQFAALQAGLPSEWPEEFLSKLADDFTEEARKDARRLFVAVALAGAFDRDQLPIGADLVIIEAIRQYPAGIGCSAGLVGEAISAMTFSTATLSPEKSAECRLLVIGAYSLALAVLSSVFDTEQKALSQARSSSK